MINQFKQIANDRDQSNALLDGSSVDNEKNQQATEHNDKIIPLRLSQVDDYYIKKEVADPDCHQNNMVKNY